MLVGDFDTASMYGHQLFRDAKIAMLTHRVLFHLEITAASLSEVEEALEEFAASANEPIAEMVAPRSAFLHLDVGQTLEL
ncbi:hypothetical protein LB553_05435 [Mesorhizobium sp. CA8]|uniref:hypothetical protein n=1 Tax=Mesorhizobium sp. CA8 TaxID=2876637 RepID=UPI001CCC6E60|nr:hypothetical protein [Mesorhizobium sp. CA8]MBZ9760317.1 hypothetical protein [Mesorhizobium sp. CA8]